MTDAPIPRFDPERLRAERRDINLGEVETDFGQTVDENTDANAPAKLLDEPTSGITPPAR